MPTRHACVYAAQSAALPEIVNFLIPENELQVLLTMQRQLTYEIHYPHTQSGYNQSDLHVIEYDQQEM